MDTRIDFTPDDEQKMKSAAGWGAFIAAASIGAALLSLLSFLTAFSDVSVPGSAAFTGFMVVAAITNFAIPLLLGVLLWKACAAFRRVATTDEDDPGNLLRGFKSLRAYFMTQGILFIIGIVAGIAMFATAGFAFDSLMPGM